MGKDILHRVGNGGHCGCETVSREVLPQVEISEKWTQEPPCFAITIWCAIKIAHQSRLIACMNKMITSLYNPWHLLCKSLYRRHQEKRHIILYRKHNQDAVFDLRLYS